MSDNNATKRKPRGGSGRIIGVILVILILLLVCLPDMCFFLSAPQKEALKLFNSTYLGKYLPMRTEGGGFDFMRLVALIIMIAGCWAVYRILMWIMSLVKTGSRRGETLKGMLCNVIRYAVVIFGAQSLIEDIFAGIFILFEGRFYVGDIISVDGFRGTVRSIGIVSTQIADVGGNIRIMNNSDIRVLTNLSDVSSVAVSIVSISYGADLVKAESVVNAVLDRLPEQYPGIFPVKPKYMGVEDLNDSSVDLKVIADVHESNIYNARRIMNRELKLGLDAGGIEIPFPQIVVWQGKQS